MLLVIKAIMTHSIVASFPLKINLTLKEKLATDIIFMKF